MTTDQIFIDLREDVELMLELKVSELDIASYDREMARINKLLEECDNLPRNMGSRSEKVNMKRELNKRMQEIRDAGKPRAVTITPNTSSAPTRPLELETSVPSEPDFNTPEPINSANFRLSIIDKKNLPKFSGNLEDWPNFNMEIRRLVLMSDACNQEKFSCLGESIPANDRLLLSAIKPDNPDINQAYKALCKKYDDPTYKVSCLWSELEVIPSVYNANDTNQWEAVLRKLRLILSLTHHTDESTRDRCFAKILKALPQQFRMDVGRRNTCTLVGLQEELLLQIKLLKLHSDPALPDNGKRSYNPRRVRINTVSSINQTCINCGQDHSLAQCHVSPSQMMEILRRNRMCFLCLDHKFSPGHKISCRMRCQQCSGFHHTTLHSQFTRTPEPSTIEDLN